MSESSHETDEMFIEPVISGNWNQTSDEVYLCRKRDMQSENFWLKSSVLLPRKFRMFVPISQSQNQSRSYITTGGLPPVSSSWRQAPWDSRPGILFLTELLR
jgi:hypothetical protein